MALFPFKKIGIQALIDTTNILDTEPLFIFKNVQERSGVGAYLPQAITELIHYAILYGPSIWAHKHKPAQEKKVTMLNRTLSFYKVYTVINAVPRHERSFFNEILTIKKKLKQNKTYQ